MAFGKILIFAGAILVVLGVIFLLGEKIPWVGKLPGDIRIERENFHFYFPLSTCIVISLVISLILWLITRS